MYDRKLIKMISKLNVPLQIFLKEFTHKINWDLISQYKLLSEDFIWEIYDVVNWNLISEDFIREFQDKVNLNLISEFQDLSKDFLTEFQVTVNCDLISES